MDRNKNTNRMLSLTIGTALLFSLTACRTGSQATAPPNGESEGVQEVIGVEENPYQGAQHASITASEAETLLMGNFGNTDPDTGYLYSFGFEDVQVVQEVEYYNFRWCWLVDDHLSYLSNVFVATDGSVIWLGTRNAEGKWVLNTANFSTLLAGRWCDQNDVAWIFSDGGSFAFHSPKSVLNQARGVWVISADGTVLTISLEGNPNSGDYLLQSQPDGSLKLEQVDSGARFTLHKVPETEANQ